jgi:catechol 2,3-dioxygenase-like lactoylglutathione lyase family enzyme
VIGRFLEYSVHSPDILASLRFYEGLGFRQLDVGEVWSHPYAVVSDGRAVIGLHAYAFDSPAVTFVLRDLAAKLPHLRRRGIDFAFAKTGDDQFNEAGFVTPAGQMVALLEARTFSPPPFCDTDFSHLGRHLGLRLGAADVGAERDYWMSLGLRLAGENTATVPGATLTGGDITVAVRAPVAGARSALLFACADTAALARRLDETSISWHAGGDATGSDGCMRLRSPEGLHLHVTPAA